MTQKQEKEHFARVEAQAKKVQTIFYRTVKEVSVITQGQIPPFNFKENPMIEAQVDNVIRKAGESLEGLMDVAVRDEWLNAVKNNSETVSRLAKKVKIAPSKLETYGSRNLEALEAFQKRKDNSGQTLSKRIWGLTGTLKKEFEMAIDNGLADGRSADELSRDIRNFLNRPNDLFRRVRTESGNLIQSQRSIKRIEAEGISYGRGMYRSSYKNAMRVARTEINHAYRMSDYEKRQQLDFVVGIEIKRSNHVYDCEVCAGLAGKYPKDFVFTGWHPHCRCYTTSILNTEDEFIAQQKAILAGTDGTAIDPAKYKEETDKEWETIKEGEYNITHIHTESGSYRFETREPVRRIDLDPAKGKGQIDIDVPVDLIVKNTGLRVDNVGLKTSVIGEFDNESKTFTIKRFLLNHGPGNEQLADHMMKELKANLPEGYTIEAGSKMKKDAKVFISKLKDEGYFKVSQPKESQNTVQGVPQGFKDYLEENKDRIERAKERGTTPWWMKDNQQFVNQSEITEVSKEKEKIEAERKAQEKAERKAEKERIKAEEEAKDKPEEEESAEFKELSMGEFEKHKDKVVIYEKEFVHIYGKDFDEKNEEPAYVANYFSYEVNARLRGKKGPWNDPEEKRMFPKIKKSLDDIISRHELPTNIKVYRWAERNYLTTLLGKPANEMTWEGLESKLNSLIGRVSSDKGFLSTSANQNFNEFKEYPIKIEMKAKKGTKAFITENIQETEVIFSRNQKMKLTEWIFDQDTEQMILKMEIL